MEKKVSPSSGISSCPILNIGHYTRSGTTYGYCDAPPCVAEVLSFANAFDGLLQAAVEDEDSRLNDGVDDEPVDLTSEPPDTPPSSPDLLSFDAPLFSPPSSPRLSGPNASMLTPLDAVPLLNAIPPARLSASSLANPSSATKSKPNLKAKARKQRDKEKEQRRERRKAAAQKKVSAYKLQESIARRLRLEVLAAIKLEARKLPHSSGGAWCGRHGSTGRSRLHALDELKKAGFRYQAWNGRKTLLLTDANGKVVVTAVGMPDGDDWISDAKETARLLRKVREEGVKCGVFKYDDLHHRRGNFLAMASGVSFGGGQTQPGNLRHSAGRRRLFNRILANRGVRRIAGFQSTCFASYAPKLFGYYASTLHRLYQHHPNLRPNFTNSIFPAVTVNCGPHSLSFNHFDKGNVSHGECAITCVAEDDYDYTKGGHLILFNLRLILEFPPGATVLIPSASVEHGNTPLPSGVTRCSVTQYAAAGLFRWVEYGFRSAKSLLATVEGRAFKARVDGERDERWTKLMDLYSTPQSLQKDRNQLASSLSNSV